jgi:uncharacterized protein (TIGR02757 family)
MRPAERRRILEKLYAKYHRPDYLETDPLAVVRRFDEPADREVVALIAASFAFGNVVSIRASIEEILRPMGEQPAEFLRASDPASLARRYRGFVYRWVRAEDLRIYLAWIGAVLREHGSLGALWAKLDDPREETILPTLGRWVECVTSGDCGSLKRRTRWLKRAEGPASPLPSGAHLLLTSPEGKSSCKRMCLFLRWVCRPDDGLDLGLWPVATSRLVMPVDTHVMKQATILGLTSRRVADLRTALEITTSLRAVDPDDPTRFDFALARAGMLASADVAD